MRIAAVHVEFWQAAKAFPRFACHLEKMTRNPRAKRPADLIHACVNSHAEVPAYSRIRRHEQQASNTCALVRLASRHEPLRDVLRRMSSTPAPMADKRRPASARKWLARLEKERPDVF